MIFCSPAAHSEQRLNSELGEFRLVFYWPLSPNTLLGSELSMRGLFYFAGVAGIVWAASLLSHPDAVSHAFWTRSVAGVTSAFAGCVLIGAAHHHYRGQWSFVIGLVLFVLGSSCLGDALDNHLAGKAYYLKYDLGMAVCLLSSSALLLYSGHRLHRASIALESLGRGLKSPSGDTAQQVAPHEPPPSMPAGDSTTQEGGGR